MGPAIWAHLDDRCASLLAEALQDETRHSTRIQACGSALRRSASPRRLPRQPHSPRQTSFSGRTSGAIAAALDQDWQSAVGGGWTREHQVLRDRDERLAQLAAVPAPTPEQIFERAELTEREGHEQEALDLYRSASARGHAPQRWQPAACSCFATTPPVWPSSMRPCRLTRCSSMTAAAR